MSLPTQGGTNANPLVGPVVISEIMYHPATPDLPEFVELHCIDTAPTPLYDVLNPVNTWLLDGAVDFVMPTGTVLQAGEIILVGATNPAALRAAYPSIPPATRVFGPYIGKLANEGERLNLSKPGTPEPGGFVPKILVDSVRYNDKPPWPGQPDGFGPSLERCDVEAYGNDSANWRNGYLNGSPGTVADGDGDSMDDSWEIFYFGNTAISDGSSTADQDADGFIDRDEWLAGTDPSDGASTLSVEGIESVTNAIVLQWQSVSGQTYAIEFSINAMGAPFMMSTGGIAADPPLNTFTSDVALPQPGFFRILVE
jgi:hypothetical protein